MTSIIFVTGAERRILQGIVERAAREVFGPAGNKRDRLDIAMDLEAAHSLCPLDFEKLRDFDAANFAHDIGGIYRHLDRDTGVLRDFFLPRCALSLSGKFYTSRPEDVERGYDHVGRVYVVAEGSARLLDPRLDLWNHSPTGLGWGYAGSGAAQLALAILAEATGDDHLAVHLHQSYKFAKVVSLPRGVWRIDAASVTRWVEAELRKEAAAHA